MFGNPSLGPFWSEGGQGGDKEDENKGLSPPKIDDPNIPDNWLEGIDFRSEMVELKSRLKVSSASTRHVVVL